MKYKVVRPDNAPPLVPLTDLFSVELGTLIEVHGRVKSHYLLHRDQTCGAAYGLWLEGMRAYHFTGSGENRDAAISCDSIRRRYRDFAVFIVPHPWVIMPDDKKETV